MLIIMTCIFLDWSGLSGIFGIFIGLKSHNLVNGGSKKNNGIVQTG